MHLRVIGRLGRSADFTRWTGAAVAVLQALAAAPRPLKPRELRAALAAQGYSMERKLSSAVLSKLLQADIVQRRPEATYTLQDGFHVTHVDTWKRPERPRGQRPRAAALPALGVTALRRLAWERVDWTKRDVDIAKYMGVSRQRAQQVRRALGKPFNRHYRRRGRSVVLLEWLAANRDRVAELTPEEIGAAAGVTLQKYRISALVHEVGLTWKRVVRRAPKLPVDANWDLPSKDLARIWGVHPQVAYRQRRNRGAPVARWDGRRWRWQRHGAKYQAYRRALEAEHRRAAARRARAAGGHAD